MEEVAAPVTVNAVRAAAAEALALARRLTTPPEGDQTPAERLRWFAQLDQAAKDSQDARKLLGDLRTAYYDRVMAALDAMGLARAPLENGPTIYRTRELWAGYDYPDDATDDDKARIRAAAHQALRAAGLDDYVQEGTNTQSLSAYFRDLERELEEQARARDGLPDGTPVSIDPDELLPPELAGYIRVTEKIYPKAKTS